jgi:hypothetical protein
MEVVETTVKVDGPIRVARIPSTSEPGVRHRVIVACSCKGFRFAGHCRHLSLAAVDVRETARLMRSITG